MLRKPCYIRLEERISIKPSTGLRSFLRQHAHAASAPPTMRAGLVGLVADRKLLLQEHRQTVD